MGSEEWPLHTGELIWDSKALSHPWYPYPSAPLSGYTHYSEYLHELLRFEEYLTSQLAGEASNRIVFWAIGMAGDELHHAHPTVDSAMQWYQLFPWYLQRMGMEYPDKQITIIVTAPESTEPRFIEQTMGIYEWRKHHGGAKYTSEIHNVELLIFDTMIPTNIEFTANRMAMRDRFRHLTSNPAYSYLADHAEWTDGDRGLTERIFDRIRRWGERLVSHDSFFLVHSYAVFNNSTDRRIIGANYRMFREIKGIMGDLESTGRSLLAEWSFSPGAYCVHDYHRDGDDRHVCMWMPSERINDGVILVIEGNRLVRVPTADLVPPRPVTPERKVEKRKRNRTKHIIRIVMNEDGSKSRICYNTDTSSEEDNCDDSSRVSDNEGKTDEIDDKGWFSDSDEDEEKKIKDNDGDEKKIEDDDGHM